MDHKKFNPLRSSYEQYIKEKLEQDDGFSVVSSSLASVIKKSSKLPNISSNQQVLKSKPVPVTPMKSMDTAKWVQSLPKENPKWDVWNPGDGPSYSDDATGEILEIMISIDELHDLREMHEDSQDKSSDLNEHVIETLPSQTNYEKEKEAAALKRKQIVTNAVELTRAMEPKLLVDKNPGVIFSAGDENATQEDDEPVRKKSKSARKKQLRRQRQAWERVLASLEKSEK